MQDERLHYPCRHFLCPSHSTHIFINIGHSGTPVYVLNGRTAFGCKCVRQRDRPGCLFLLLYAMLQNYNHLCNALSSVNGTSAHDTSLLSAVTNPYAYFDRMGIDLQDFTLRYLRQPRKNGVSVTGTFNISGIYYTAGAADVPQLLADVLERYHAKQAYHHRCQDRKQERNLQTYINRYPDAMVLPAYFS